jgi:hypothetical protein
MPRFAVVADQAPAETDLTDYDLKHFSTYLRLLDTDAEGVDWLRRRAQSCTLIRPLNPIRHGARGKPT